MRKIYMSRQERAARRDAIVAAHMNGVSAREIACLLGLTQNTVNKAITESGQRQFGVPKGYTEDGIDPIWGLCDGERRIAIAKRAAAGAQLRRREITLEYYAARNKNGITGKNPSISLDPDSREAAVCENGEAVLHTSLAVKLGLSPFEGDPSLASTRAMEAPT